jgi:mRNA interferase MazF
MVMVIKQYDIFLISLYPPLGHEIKKVRPCMIISPNEMNDHISTIIIAPMTTCSHFYPTRVAIDFEGKKGWIVLDQLRALDKKRFVKKLGQLNHEAILNVKRIIQEMLVA